MDVNIRRPEDQRFVADRVASGAYATADEVVSAGLAALQEAEGFGDFATGELDALIAEAEESIATHGTIPAEEVFAELRSRRGSQSR